MFWACARLEPHRERLALHCLSLRGFATYWPQVRGKPKPEALFPGYCFISITLQWSPARWSPGIISLLMTGEQPAHVPDRIIEDLRSRERNGFVALPPRPRPGDKFQRGDRVRIAVGPLSGFVGLVDGMRGNQRVEILLAALGRVELAAAAVARLA
jgi:transcriptional antiterminator RfaH